MRRSVLTLVLLACLTFLAGLGRQAITDSDEAFYAEAAREMVDSGDWLTPHFNYQDRWQKPVLYYWLTAATYLITGPGEGAARFWSALSGVGLVLLTWAAARAVQIPNPKSQSPKPNADWLAGAIVATCFGYFAEARLALPDLPLAFCVTLGIWAALRATDTRRGAWWIVAGLGAGLGFLMKGPVAVVLPGLVLLPVWWRERRSIRLSTSGIAIAALVFAVVGLPWYAAMWRAHGNDYLRYFFLENNVERFTTSAYNEPRAIWFYVPIALGGLLPWSAYLVAAAIDGTARVVKRQRTLSATDWRLLLWAIVPLLFYTVSVGKQPRYILPVLPPIAILTARAIALRIDESTGSRANRALAIATWATAALFAFVAVLLARAQPLFISVYAAMSVAGIVVLVAAALLIAWVAFAHRWTRLPGVVAACSAALLLIVQFGALAGRRPEAVEQMAALVHANRIANEPVGEYQVFVRNLVFYLGFQQKELFDEAAAREFVQSPEPVLLVVRRGNVEALQAAAGVTLRTLGEVSYLNTANLKIRSLLAPDPARDVERVLLVTNR